MADVPIRLMVRAVPDEDFFLGVDQADREVDQGDVATFAFTLSGEHVGGIDLTILNLPEGAVATFNPPNPASVGDTVTLTIETANMPAVTATYEMVVRATAVI